MQLLRGFSRWLKRLRFALASEAQTPCSRRRSRLGRPRARQWRRGTARRHVVVSARSAADLCATQRRPLFVSIVHETRRRRPSMFVSILRPPMTWLLLVVHEVIKRQQICRQMTVSAAVHRRYHLTHRGSGAGLRPFDLCVCVRRFFLLASQQNRCRRSSYFRPRGVADRLDPSQSVNRGHRSRVQRST